MNCLVIIVDFFLHNYRTFLLLNNVYVEHLKNTLPVILRISMSVIYTKSMCYIKTN